MDILILKQIIIILFIMNEFLYQHNHLKINNHNYQYLLHELDLMDLSINRKISLNPNIVHVNH